MTLQNNTSLIYTEYMDWEQLMRTPETAAVFNRHPNLAKYAKRQVQKGRRILTIDYRPVQYFQHQITQQIKAVRAVITIRFTDKKDDYEYYI